MSKADHEDIVEKVCVSWADVVTGTNWLTPSADELTPHEWEAIILDTRNILDKPCVPGGGVLCTEGVGGPVPVGTPGINIPTANVPPPPDVPLPASAWLILGGLGVMWAWKNLLKTNKEIGKQRTSS